MRPITPDTLPNNERAFIAAIAYTPILYIRQREIISRFANLLNQSNKQAHEYAMMQLLDEHRRQKEARGL
jgi:hypothetical protein